MDTKAIVPLPGTRVLITQMRKAGTTEQSYASMTNYPDDEVGLHRTHTRCHQVGLPTKTAWDKTPIKVNSSLDTTSTRMSLLQNWFEAREASTTV